MNSTIRTATAAAPAGAKANAANTARAAAPVVRKLRMADGVDIAVHELASLRPAHAHAVILHGTGMDSRVYFPFARLLAAQGVRVSLLDQRGHGASGGEQGQVAHVMQYADDLRECLGLLQETPPELPLFVLAHSGGSAIALKALPALRTPLCGLAMLAPTLAHDPLMARRRGSGQSWWRDWRYGVAARPAREVKDDGRSAMSFHLGTFALARLLRIGTHRPALICQPANDQEPSFSYSSDAVTASMVSTTEAPLAQVPCPILLATGERDFFVNDASVHLALPWMLAPEVPFRAYSYPGADHFTTLFHATSDILGWIRATLATPSAAVTSVIKPHVVVHRPVKQTPVPLLQRRGRDWQLLEMRAASPSAATHALPPPGDDALLDVLSDLAHYGMVLPLAEVAPDTLLWWAGHAAPQGELRVPVTQAAPDDTATDTRSRIQWDSAAPSDDRWRYGVSASARWIAASTGLPMVHPELLTLAAAVDSLPLGEVYLALSPVNAAALSWLWNPRTGNAVQRRSLLLRERRRLALGLPAQHDDAQLNAMIERHFVLPVAQQLLDAMNPDARRQLRLLTQDEFAALDAATQTVALPVGRYLSDDPLGDNIYVLGSRRIPSAAPLARQMRATGRSIVTLAHRTQTSDTPKHTGPPPDWGAAMLAALQLDYLQTHRATLGLFG